MLDVVLLSRLQFALTVGFHYLFPPISIGLGIILVIMEGMYIKTKDKKYEQMTKFWVNIFGLTFVLGVATGIVMEFEFGTNWSTYSRFVGDVFGSPLAAEGVFAFFLESCFLAILIFGWKKVSPKFHFVSTILVAFGAHLSALWIIVANSWQQTPAGFHIVGFGSSARAEIVDFRQLVFNPSTMDRFLHTLSAAWLTGAFCVLCISAYYILKKRHLVVAKSSLKISLVIAVISAFLHLFTGHLSAMGISRNQPAKLASFEGHFVHTPAYMYIIGWVDEANSKTYGIKLPGMLSFIVFFDASQPLAGLNEFKPSERPPVNFVFQTYHIMGLIGMLLILISVVSLILLPKGRLFQSKFMLKVLIVSVVLPQLGNQLGWISAEVGRQPWIVYGLLKTSEAVSKTVSGSQVLFSIILFGLIYLFLFILYIFLLTRKVKHGIEDSADSEFLSSEQNVITGTTNIQV
jgi:cytochrome d ubiquinol oxidase subunit I